MVYTEDNFFTDSCYKSKARGVRAVIIYLHAEVWMKRHFADLLQKVSRHLASLAERR